MNTISPSPIASHPEVNRPGAALWNPDRQGQHNPSNQHDQDQEANPPNKLQHTAKQLGTSVLHAGLAAHQPNSSPELLHTTPRNQAVTTAIHALLEPEYNTGQNHPQRPRH